MTFVQDPPIGQTAKRVVARQAVNQNPTPAPSPYYFMTPSVDQRTLTPEQIVEADAYFAQLEAEGAYEGWKYMQAHVPAHMQEYFLQTHPDPSIPPEAPIVEDALARGDQSALPGYQGAAYDPRLPR